MGTIWPESAVLAHGVGLAEAAAGEVVTWAGRRAVIRELRAGHVRLSLLDPFAVRASVQRTRRQISIPTSPDLLGRVVDPLGRPLDGRPPVAGPRASLRGRPRHQRRRSRWIRSGLLMLDGFLPLQSAVPTVLWGPGGTGRRAVAASVAASFVEDGGRLIWVSLARPPQPTPGALVIGTPIGATAPLRALALEAAAIIGEAWQQAGHEVLVVVDTLDAWSAAAAEEDAALGRPCWKGLSVSAGARVLAAIERIPDLLLIARDCTILAPDHGGTEFVNVRQLRPALAQQGVFPPIDLLGDYAQCWNPPYFDRRLSPTLGFADKLPIWRRAITARGPFTDFPQRLRRLLDQPRGLRYTPAEAGVLLVALTETRATPDLVWRRRVLARVRSAPDNLMAQIEALTPRSRPRQIEPLAAAVRAIAAAVDAQSG